MLTVESFVMKFLKTSILLRLSRNWFVFIVVRFCDKKWLFFMLVCFFTTWISKMTIFNVIDLFYWLNFISNWCYFQFINRRLILLEYFAFFNKLFLIFKLNILNFRASHAFDFYPNLSGL
jgi:hypothetical protein